MTIRELADDPISYDHDGLQGIVADAVDGRLNTLNTDTTSAADLEKELTDVVEEAVTEVGKLAHAKKRFDDAVTAEASADGASAQRAAQKEMKEAASALKEAQAEYDLKEAEILAKLLDILERAGLISGETGTPLDNDHSLDDPKPKGSDKPDSPGDKPSDNSPGDSPGDNPSSDSPSSPGQTKLSSDTNPAQQQPQQAQAQPQQAQQQQPSMSPSMGMPQQQQPNVSPSAFNVRPRDKDKDRDKRQDSDIDRGVLPVATPVPAAVPIDRGSSGTGVTTRDVSGKPSTSLSTSGQVPGAVNGQTPRGGVGGGMVGAPPPIGSGGKADTAGKRGGKRFDLESLFTKPDNDDQRVNSGSLSKDSIAATDKAREEEQDRMYRAMRESAKRAMEKKAG